jgi:hypothetical protein
MILLCKRSSDLGDDIFRRPEHLQHAMDACLHLTACTDDLKVHTVLLPC